jgi:phosphoglycolate phosphatase-like HAD superfamily hydrolase
MPLARTLFTEDKKLRVFDFDDTLVKTTSFIYVTHRDGKKSKLTPGEYAVYKEKPGDEFDYADFQKVSNPKLIKGYFELLKRMSASDGGRKIFILTARSAYKPVHQFIKDLGIRNLYVVALGDANPEKKADWIEQKVKDEGYDDVFFVDDSLKNVEAVKNRLRKYPKVKQKIQHVKSKELPQPKPIIQMPKSDLDKTIKNPDTGRDIKLKSALHYDKDSQVYKAAISQIKK